MDRRITHCEWRCCAARGVWVSGGPAPLYKDTKVARSASRAACVIYGSGGGGADKAKNCHAKVQLSRVACLPSMQERDMTEVHVNYSMQWCESTESA